MPSDRADRTDRVDDVEDTDRTVRAGERDDLLAVMRVLDGAMLDVDAAAVRRRLSGVDADSGSDPDGEAGDVGGKEGDRSGNRNGNGTGTVLVAEADGRVVGALVLDGGHVEAVAVRRSRRGQGVGTALVGAAAARAGRLTADFDPRVAPFYESLGFAVTERGDGRLRGVLSAER